MVLTEFDVQGKVTYFFVSKCILKWLFRWGNAHFFGHFEHVCAGFFVIVANNAIEDGFFDGVFNIADSFAGRQTEYTNKRLALINCLL